MAFSLDGGETSHAVLSLNEATSLSRIGEFSWKTRNTDNRVISNLSVDHEYIHIYSENGSPIQGRKIDRSNFKNVDDDPRGPYTTDPLTGKANKDDRPNLHYVIKNPDTNDIYKPDPDFGWITNESGFSALLSEKKIHWPSNPKTGKPRKKRFLQDASPRAPIGSMSISIKQGEGNLTLANIMGSKKMNFPKPVSVIKTVVDTCAPEDSMILDHFAGSGTTAQAVIEMNRDDGSARKYILVEMGDYFDSVLKPRVKKIIFSKDWKDGKPKPDENGNYNGVSHCFKYLRLESYEDALNNLVLKEDERRDAALEKDAELFHDYMLGYWLDVKTRGSASLLNVDQFKDPTNYRMKIKRPGGDESVDQPIDLVETFNWLIGLHVELLDKPRTFSAEFERETDPDLPEDSNTRLTVKDRLRESDDGKHWFRTVQGWVARTPGSDTDRESVLVIWRKLTDSPEEDAAALESLLTKQLRINQRDTEFDAIYVNGPHGLSTDFDGKHRLHSLEETFHARMWATDDHG